MKKLIPVLALLLVFFQGVGQTNNDPKKPEYLKLSRTMGYLYGQEYYLEIIKNKFPELSLSILKAELEFKSAFGEARLGIEEEMQAFLGEKFYELKPELRKQFKQLLKDSELTKEVAIAFIDEVHSRAKGNITSPEKEALLSYRFKDNPQEEFKYGFTKTFRTLDHAKSKEIDFQVDIPLSWVSEEGNRPNIIQKFTSKNGNGEGSILLMVKDLGFEPTEAEMNDFFDSEEIRLFVPEEGVFISSKKLVIDNHPGGMIRYSFVGRRMDVEVETECVSFIAIRGDKLILMQCLVGQVADRKEGFRLSERFKTFYPLFWQVANSLIINEQY